MLETLFPLEDGNNQHIWGYIFALFILCRAIAAEGWFFYCSVVFCFFKSHCYWSEFWDTAATPHTHAISVCEFCAAVDIWIRKWRKDQLPNLSNTKLSALYVILVSCGWPQVTTTLLWYFSDLKEGEQQPPLRITEGSYWRKKRNIVNWLEVYW